MTAEISIYNPKTMTATLGMYNQVARVKASELLFVAGQLSSDATGTTVGVGDFEAQMRQVFANVKEVLASAGATFANIVQFTTYLVHSQDISKFMEIRKELFSEFFPDEKYPPNTLLIIDRLVKEDFLIEVQTVAAI